jgi:hypothetical protein
MRERKRDLCLDVATARELLAFVRRGRTWWLTPMVLALILLSALVVFLESSALAPFVYTLF